MLIYGQWVTCDDGIVRPIIEGEVLAADGVTWEATEFLLDTGADRTVFHSEFLTTLALPHLPAAQQLGGVGGGAITVSVGTEIRFPLYPAGTITIKGRFSAFTRQEALDTNVLGRDITNLFAVIIDKPGGSVCMLASPHHYTIKQ